MGDFSISAAGYSFQRTWGLVLILVQIELPGVLICNADSRVQCPEVLIQQVWGGTQKFAFFRSSWAILSNTDPSIALL